MWTAADANTNAVNLPNVDVGEDLDDLDEYAIEAEPYAGDGLDANDRESDADDEDEDVDFDDQDDMVDDEDGGLGQPLQEVGSLQMFT